jgi:3,4-dihydroxy 2-butanone 4-phosphate synthase/GTP cyclohydrolase II
MLKTDYPRIAGPIELPALLPGEIIANFRLYFFMLPEGTYYVLEKGDVRGAKWPLVRIQSTCNIAHIFNSQRCDCEPQLELAMELLHNEGKGILIYVVHHEGRGVGPFDHVRVYQKQDEGFDTVDSYLEPGLLNFHFNVTV